MQTDVRPAHTVTPAPKNHMDAPGTAYLRFIRVGSTTVLAEERSTVPLATRQLASKSGCAEVALLNVGGGILSGDDLRIAVTAERHSHVRLVSVGATRIYKALGKNIARQTLSLCVDEGALLEYLPDETIPFAGARYRSTTRVELQQGARALVREVLTPGRQLSGELFAYDLLDLATTADIEGVPVLRERLLLNSGSASSLAVLGQYTHLASLCCLGWPDSAQLARLLHDYLAEQGAYGSASSARDGVVLLKVLGHNAHELLRLTSEAAALCRQLND